MAARESSMGTCYTSKTNVNLDFSSVDIGFLGVTISHVTFSCSQHLYNIIRITMQRKRKSMLVQNVHCIFKDNLTEGLDFGNKKSYPFPVYKQSHVMHNFRLLLETVQ